jgi:hypothetical protein
VKFLDIDAAVRSLCRTAGLQFAENVKRWSSLGSKLDDIIKELQQEQEKRRAQQGSEDGPQEQQEEVAGTGGRTTILPGGDPEYAGEEGEQQAQQDTSRLTGKLRKRPIGTAPVGVPDPTRVPLPNAPNFKIYCIYGVGTPTERGYHYLKTDKGNTSEWSINNVLNDPASGLVSGGSPAMKMPAGSTHVASQLSASFSNPLASVPCCGQVFE